MALRILFIIISSLWLISEVALARVRRSKKEASKNRDKSSLRFLWITILICVPIGVLVGAAGIGYIAVRSYLLAQLGLALIVLGLAIRWTAIFTLKRYFTVNVSIVDNHQIIQKGIYKFIRHPAYAGSLLSFLGLGLSFSNWLSTLVILIPVWVAFLYRIKVEERVLSEVFGDKYAEYCKRTKRVIPGIY